jgi:ubiquinone/menaquinone biosynthesis C-methylase UbiE
MQRDPEGSEQKTLLALVDLKDKRVLDIGCGEGRLTFKYAAASSLTVGFDPDHDALRIARTDSPHAMQKHVHFAGAGASHIPFSKETFDIAILAWSL